jgi:hypothetical protein
MLSSDMSFDRSKMKRKDLDQVSAIDSSFDAGSPLRSVIDLEKTVVQEMG